MYNIQFYFKKINLFINITVLHKLGFAKMSSNLLKEEDNIYKNRLQVKTVASITLVRYKYRIFPSDERKLSFTAVTLNKVFLKNFQESFCVLCEI